MFFFFIPFPLSISAPISMSESLRRISSRVISVLCGKVILKKKKPYGPHKLKFKQSSLPEHNLKPIHCIPLKLDKRNAYEMLFISCVVPILCLKK